MGKQLFTTEQIIWIEENYPLKGPDYCANYLNVTKKQLKQFTYRHNLYMKRNIHIWKSDDIQQLRELYPHYGTRWTSKFMGIPRPIIKKKIDLLRLTMLPKQQRLCLRCKINYQSLRRYGFLCKQCFSEFRKKQRRNEKSTIKQRFQELIRTAKKRSSNPCDLTPEYLQELLIKQNGKCYYSGIQMNFEKWGKGRKIYSLSLDQVIPQGGYTKDNIVLCTVAANFAKNNFSKNEFIQFCKKVTEYNR